MRRPDSTSSPAARDTDPGAREPSHLADEAGRRGWLAALATIGLLVSLFAPWYAERVSARGLGARHVLVQELSGWQALSAASLACAFVAVALAALAVLRARTPVHGLGAVARSIARGRVDGAFVAAGGLVCVVMILSTIVAPPTAAVTAAIATTSTGVRWGVLLSLVFAAGLTMAGVRMIGEGARQARRERRPDRRSAVRRPGADRRASATDVLADGPLPEFDFGARTSPHSPR